MFSPREENLSTRTSFHMLHFTFNKEPKAPYLHFLKKKKGTTLRSPLSFESKTENLSAFSFIPDPLLRVESCNLSILNLQ